MRKLYRVLFIYNLFAMLLYTGEAAAQAPFTVTGIVSNTSCYGLSNGAINLTVTGAGGGASSGNYCTPSYSTDGCNCSSTWDFINNFSTTDGSTNISNLNSGCNGSLPSNYTFFSAMTVTVNQGQSFGVNVQCGTTGCASTYSHGFRIWVDWNNDGDFADANEDAWNSVTAGFQMFTGNITVPAGTACGPKRMRVRSTYAGIPGSADYCTQFTFGECEDYNVQVCTPADYIWSNGATTEDIDSLPAGQYTVTVTAGTQSSIVTFNVNQPSQVITNITATNNDTLLCPGESTTLTASGQPTWNYTWSNGLTGNTITVSQVGVYSVTVSNTNGCSSTDSITVLSASSTNPPVITPSDTTLVCQGSSVTLTANPSASITWQPGGQSSSSIDVSQSGDFYVTYTDAAGCTGQSLPVTVLVIPPPVAAITPGGTTTFCEGESVTLTSNYIFGNSWSNGSTATSITVTTSGSYGLTVTLSGGCSSAATAVDVTANPLPTPQITPNGPTTFCEGGNVILASNYATGNYWSSTSTWDQITVDLTSSYTLTVTDANGCTGSAGPVDVVVNPTPAVPVITASGPTTFCDGNSVILTSSYASGNQWSLNNLTTNAITVTQSGTYTVTQTDATGCTAASLPFSVTVNPVPTSTFTVPATTCIVDNATITYIGTAAVGAQYDWSFDSSNVVSGSGQGPYTLSFGSIGNYNITLQVTDANGCVSTTGSQNITVNTNPDADFMASVSGVCDGDSLTVSYSGLATNTATYDWNFGNATVLSGSGQGPYTLGFTTPGINNITLTVTQGSCSSEPYQVAVDVHALPNAGFNADVTAGCDSITVQFYPLATASTYDWNFGDGAVSNINSPMHLYLPGIYSVSLSIVDINGCANSFVDSSLIQVYPTPVAAFTSTPNLVDTLNMDEAMIQFINQSTNAIGFDWNFGDTFTSIEYNPTHAYVTSGAYTVQLIATNQLGCSDTATSETFYVLPGAVTFIPNTFSPNGDGTNDVFRIYSNRYKKAFFTVYDRLGEKLFETTDIETGWDGTLQKKACNTGVYVYYAKILFLTGEEKEFFGDVTLLR